MLLVLLIHFQQVNVFFLFELIFLLRLMSLVSKSLFITKFACANLAANFFTVKLVHSEVVIHLS